MDRQKLSCSMEVCGVQKRVSPPLGATTVSHLRRIEPNNRWIKTCWMLFYSCTSGSRSSCSASGEFWRRRTRLLSSSNKCSIGDISGDNAGQGRTRMWFWFRNSWQSTSHVTPCVDMEKDMIKVSLLQKVQKDRIKNIVSVSYGIQCSVNNFELSVTITRNSRPDHNTSASKTVGPAHTLGYKTCPTLAIHR